MQRNIPPSHSKIQKSSKLNRAVPVVTNIILVDKSHNEAQWR